MSPKDRKRLAAYLYSEHEWARQKIADVLGTAQQRISEDLRELPESGKLKRGRPKGTGELKTLVEIAADQRAIPATGRGAMIGIA